MKQLVLALSLLAAPAFAQDKPPADDLDQGFSLLQEGARLLLRGMVTQMEPTLDDMAEAWSKAEPRLSELLALIDDLAHYEAPELLENGDILIRRKPDLPLPAPPAASETEL